LLQWWDKHGLKDVDYYKRLRAFVSGLGYSGPILWADIAKCQNKSKTEKLSVIEHPQTFRKCSSLFLAKEIACCPNDWPIVAAGRDAYLALLYLCPDRALLGVSHPTGRFANKQFLAMFEKELRLKPEIYARVQQHFAREPQGVLKL
jgi:hypothetical protein